MLNILKRSRVLIPMAGIPPKIITFSEYCPVLDFLQDIRGSQPDWHMNMCQINKKRGTKSLHDSYFKLKQEEIVLKQSMFATLLPSLTNLINHHIFFGCFMQLWHWRWSSRKWYHNVEYPGNHKHITFDTNWVRNLWKQKSWKCCLPWITATSL